MPRTNGETLLWHQEGLLNGRVSEEKFNSEAIKFFGLSQDESCKSKQYFKKDIQDFIDKHVNLQNNILREYLEENGGIGKHNETPPEDFRTELQEEKQRRLAFFKIWPQRDEILKKNERNAKVLFDLSISCNCHCKCLLCNLLEV